MGKYISGILKCVIKFDDEYVRDCENDIDAIFPDGWQGEMLDCDLKITNEYED